MHFKGFYKQLNDSQIENSIQNEGFNPAKITNGASNTYSPHKHPETKLLAFLKGEMKVKAGGNTFDCKPGDKLIIQGNVTHSAICQSQGCTFFWAEKLLTVLNT